MHEQFRAESRSGVSVIHWTLFVVVATVLSIAGGYRFAWRWEDAYWYKLMAEGRTAHVIAPFSHRPLTPLIVRAIGHLSHWRVDTAFFVFGIVSMLLFAGCVGWLLCKQNVSRFLLWTVALTALWPLSFENYILPDLFNAALLAIFVVLLFQKKYLWAGVMLFPLAVSRETVFVVAICYLVVAWRELRWREIAVAVIATVGGSGTVKFLARAAESNRHHLGTVAYLAGKAPWNFSANVLGIAPWSNDLRTFCAVPHWSHAVPFHFGSIHRVGECGYMPLMQLKWVSSMLCLFGLLPVILVFFVAKTKGSAWTKAVFLRFCVVYGVVCFLLAPLLGSAVDRLVSYSWPLFLIATPILVRDIAAGPRWRKVFLLFAGTGISWWGFYVEQGSSVGRLVLFVMIALIANGAAWVLLRKRTGAREDLPHPVAG